MQELKEETANILGDNVDWDLILKKMDLNDDGQIDYNEFVSAFYSSKSIMNDQNIENAFNALDRDQSGKITIEEIKSSFGQEHLNNTIENAMEKSNLELE